ncbi:PepSY domain-containing protein [Micromonospora sp. NPDC049900]|uniref:PepSY domain-containing protein n=1 Tax=Micromonospora sp. NPDC049900 TaxID=3364275 RepID=UPI0037AB189A
MKRNPLILASVGGAAAVLAAAGIFLGVTAADNDRTRQTTLTAATAAPEETAPAAPDAVTPPADPGTVAPPSDPGSVAPPTDPSTAAPPAGTSPDAADKISRERAGEIALAHVGGGRITEVDRDRENKRPVWEVEIVNGDVEHEVDVDRETGQVLKAEQERYDGDDDDRDDDDDDDDDRDDD